MAELVPYPFGALVDRMFRELESHEAIYDLPARKFFLGQEGRDYSVTFHGHVASTPLGPAAGPQSQMAQNIVLSWLGGCRIMELKTVQIMDELDIPRPCIDMQTIGYNVEWSQELKLQQSLHEYVKGSMLVEILRASGKLELAGGFEDVIYDMSVGYDLKGIQSEPVLAFIRGMMDATEVVEHYRAQIPDAYQQYRKLDFQTKLSDTLTLSTFHGCPPDEIEKIIDFCLREIGLHCVIKLNPMLLGPRQVRHLLNDTMGYTDVHVPETAFERDTKWEQAQGIVERLGATAAERGLGLGVKFSNTLIVENHRDFFPAEEKEMYLSGAPLHVLAMNLVRQFRERFGDQYPITFSAGIDRGNFADAVAIGLTPITVCSDLLRPGGYGRACTYFKDLNRRMDKLGAENIGDYILRAYGNGAAALRNAGVAEGSAAYVEALATLEDGGAIRGRVTDETYERWVSEAKLLNTWTYVEAATQDPRYAIGKNSKAPRKIGSMLELFDCISCDKCVPVCPNDANFTLPIPAQELPILKMSLASGEWSVEEEGTLALEEKHQIANFADFCNECGNCDIFCPEDGGPYILKPRFFGDMDSFNEFKTHDGFCVQPLEGGRRIDARFDGAEYSAEIRGKSVSYGGPGFSVAFDRTDPKTTISGAATGTVDLTYFAIMECLAAGACDSGSVNYVSMLN